MRNAVSRLSHTVMDDFIVLSEVIYNSSLIKIYIEYLLVEVLCSRARKNAEAYKVYIKRRVFRNSATMGISCFTF